MSKFLINIIYAKKNYIKKKKEHNFENVYHILSAVEAINILY